ncbi:MAG: DUF3108 domain-containing protein [Methylophilus sp.]
MSKLDIREIQDWLSDIAFKRLCLAIVLSALLHLLLIGKGGFIGLPTSSGSRVALKANIVISHPKSLEKNVSEVATALPEPESKPEAIPEVKPEPVPEMVEEALEPLPEVPVIQPETNQSIAENSYKEEAKLPADIREDYARDADPEPLPYQYVETDFDVYVNDDEARSGKAKIVYDATQSDHYQLRWEVEATGVLALFYPNLVQTSEGKVSEQGLRPNQYLYQIGDNKDKTYSAVFNWSDHLVKLSSSKSEKTAELTGNTQDLLSFMYQFMYVPPLSEMLINITNGKKVAEYDYDFVGEETLELKFVNVKTYHIKHSKVDSDDKTELWLAKDYHFVPVKIRKTEKNGTVIEQVATSLITKDQIENTPLP